MIKPTRYPITVVIDLKDLERYIQRDKEFLLILDSYQYVYQYFLEDFLYFFLRDIYILPIKEELDKVKQVQYSKFITLSKSQDYIAKYNQFLYTYIFGRIPSITKECDYHLHFQYGNSLYYIHID